ncbi:MAG: FtsX-like permease family protein [Alphaproteobacteria bacterium]|nr:FtsX-like permease family protein [Alphaproteobacteria bacterium]MBU1561834.1 FtsX-like permease family protein [Alphaproteobacteria bacterium]MBU2304568.1 FtsX-like permease family protein [Alphaproteobacteria bacterium]MBU2368100.1 FtsX-like permease family protein [Alphaproteobacteria bacterium]
MLYSIKIATRYLTATRGQSLLLVLGVAVGVYVFVFMSALIGGLAVLLIDRTVGSIAHVIVEPADRNPALLKEAPGTLLAVLKSSQQRPTLQSAEAYLPILETAPHVSVVVGKLLGNGFMVKGEAVAPVQITGLESKDISAIADIDASLVAGSSELMLGTAVIGSGLAESLGIGIGQSLVIRSERDVEQSITIGGIFQLGLAAVDNAAVYLNIRAARVLLDLPEGLSRYEIKLDDLQQARVVADDLRARTGLKATAWQDQNAQLLEGLTAQARSGDLIKGFALVTIIIGVASALLLSTYRRQSEIGIMRAMGASRGFVVTVFVIQGALVGLAGGLLGAGLGYLSLLPFPPPELTSGGGLPVDYRQGAYGAAIALTLAGAIAAALWPAYAASRIDPVKAIGP